MSLNTASSSQGKSLFEAPSEGHDAPSESCPSILIYNGNFPLFPGAGGHEFLNTTNLARFASRVGLISMIHTCEAVPGVSRLAGHNVETFLWKNPQFNTAQKAHVRSGIAHTVHKKLASLIYWLKAFPSRPCDTVNADLEFRNMAPAVIQALDNYSWNALVVVQSTCAAVVDNMPRTLVSALVMHDIRSRVFARQAEVATSTLQRFFLRRQARLYSAFEKKYVQRYDLVIALSNVDAEWIRKNYGAQSVAVVPIPVDSVYFSPSAMQRERTARILFTGLMDHGPNVDAAVFFAREVFPDIRGQFPNADFFVVGRNPSKEVRSLKTFPGVTVTGWVPDTRPYLEEASVVVVPLRFGSGVRNKILEAWAMEKCVVSTTLGAEGLSYENGRNLVIADNREEIAEAVIRLLGNPAMRRGLGTAGHAVAVTEHQPEKVAATFYKNLKTVVQNKIAADPMRVALDMRWLTPGLAGGLENQARSFVRHLLAFDTCNSYSMIVPACCRHDFDLRGRRNFRIISRDSAAPMVRHIFWRASRLLHGAARIDYWRSPEVERLRFLRSLDAEIVYSFPGYIHPEMLPLPQVLFVPDIQHEYLPHMFSESALEERRRIYTESIARARHICTASEFTRTTLIERLNIAPEKITPVLLAADPIFSAPRDPSADRTVKVKYSLPEQYLFFPAHTWPHKNHLTLLESLKILRGRYGKAPALICTGGSREAMPAIFDYITKNGLERQVRFLGYCPIEEMPSLYRNATCLVFPSLFEGFGMPVLEAMATGCPVVCSNVTSLPEISGRAALLVDPLAPEEWAQSIDLILKDGDLRTALIARGLQQAARFSWRRHTLDTIKVLHRVHRELRSGK